MQARMRTSWAPRKNAGFTVAAFRRAVANGTGVHRSQALWVAKRLVCIPHLS